MREGAEYHHITISPYHHISYLISHVSCHLIISSLLISHISTSFTFAETLPRLLKSYMYERASMQQRAACNMHASMAAQALRICTTAAAALRLHNRSTKRTGRWNSQGRDTGGAAAVVHILKACKQSQLKL